VESDAAWGEIGATMRSQRHPLEVATQLCRGRRNWHPLRSTLGHSLLVVALVSVAHRGFVAVEILRPRMRLQQPTVLHAATHVAETSALANPTDPPPDSAATPAEDPDSRSAVQLAIERKEQLANQLQLTLGCELAKGDIEYGIVGTRAFVRLRVLETEGREALRFSATNPALLQGDVLSDNRNHVRVAEGLAAQRALEGVSNWLATVSQGELDSIRDRKSWNRAYMLRNNPKHVLNELLMTNLHQKLSKGDFQYRVIGNNTDGGPKEVVLRLPVLEPVLGTSNLEFKGVGETIKDAQRDAASLAVTELKPIFRDVKKRRYQQALQETDAEGEPSTLESAEQIAQIPKEFVKLGQQDKSLTLNLRLNRVAENLVEEITWNFASMNNTKEIQLTLDNFRMRMMLLALAKLPEHLRCSAQLVVVGELASGQQRQRRKEALKQKMLQLGMPKLKPLTRFALRVIRDAPVAESDTDPFMVDSFNTDPAKLAPELKKAFEEGTNDGDVIELQFAGDGTGGPSSNAGKAIRFLQLAYLQERKQVRFGVRFTDIIDENDFTKPGMTVSLTLS